MNVMGVGDLASSLLARRSNADLKGEFVKLSQELASGRKSDAFATNGGHTSAFVSVEHTLRLLDAFDESNLKVSQKLNHAEIALGAISGEISGLGAELLASADAGSVANSAIQAGATNSFQATLSALSVRIGPAYVFSGNATTTPPLATAETILSDLQTLTAGATTAADFYQRVDDWFMLPGGFDTTGYLGGAPSDGGIRISETDEISFEVTAQSEEIRTILRDLAVVSLVEQDSFGGSAVEEVELIKSTATGLISSEAGLTKIRAAVGESQEQVAAASSQNLFQRNSLMQVKGEMLNVDLFETAARFEEIQLQLESLYLVTAKTARLSLTGYLR